MNGIDTQESRKTIIAFAAGLLIGALLVWAFTSATPSTSKESGTANDAETGKEDTKSNNYGDTSSVDGGDSVTNGGDTSVSMDKGSEEETFSVNDQKAGSSVALGDLSFPDGIGWVVVRDYDNGAIGNILGAARFDVAGGLVPSQIELLRETIAGKSYRVSFYMDDGDLSFNSFKDTAVEGSTAFFTAE